MKFTYTLRQLTATSLLCLSILSGMSLSAQTQKGTALLTSGLQELKYYGPDQSSNIVKQVSVTGQPFSKALEINTFGSKAGSSGLQADIPHSIKKGDVLWISFKAKCLQSKRETGEAYLNLSFEQLLNGKYKWPTHLERGISVGAEWVETSIPFVMEKDVKPEDIRLNIQFDTYPEHFVLGPITFINYGPEIKLADLPRSTVRYGGDEPGAAWRKEAAANIEKFRKGELKIVVLDQNNKPLPGADVSVRMKRHDYAWSTATSSQRLLDTVNPDSRIYRDTLLKYFNQVVFENEIKWPYWTGPKANDERTFKALDWLKEKNIPVRGTVMIWPSWGHLPKYIQDLKNDTAALRAETFKFIKKQTSTFKGRFVEWDITNELYAHHDMIDLLGRQEVIKWYRAVNETDPDVKLFYNEYTMFHNEKASQHFYDYVKYLKDNGAPIHGIGEQGHIGGTPPSIPMIIERLNKFAELGLPIQISEFDITSNDDDFKARYLRDFMTAVYSHPSTIGIIQWGFWEGQHWFPIAALWNKDWSIRPNGKAFTDLVYKTFWTDADGKTDKDGNMSLRGFCGEYEITVRSGKSSITKSLSLSNKGNLLEIKID